jgi:dTDP-4-dehydrorhamnose 3,5-epimerase
VSNKNILRGMHFQLPPYDHDKLVSCLAGSVLDVVIDLRKKSATYKHFDSFNLNQNDTYTLYIPSGMAHGFLSLEDNSGMLYNTSRVHAPEKDCGIHWNSFDFDWGCDNPIVSIRDQNHTPLDNFTSSF